VASALGDIRSRDGGAAVESLRTDEDVRDAYGDRLLARLRLEQALDRLSPEHREAIVQVHYRGRTCAEVADDLGVPASTMRSRLHYGVRELRLVLEENGWLA